MCMLPNTVNPKASIVYDVTHYLLIVLTKALQSRNKIIIKNLD